mgnify:FL=1
MMKKFKVWFLMIFFFLCSPTFVWAYSNKVILGGENIGIHIETPGVMVIGFYRVNGDYLKGTPEIQVGDYITKINDIPVETIDELTTTIEKEVQDNSIQMTVLRDGNEIVLSMNLEVVDGIYKTGLYVKDSITGIGTLTYIDPGTKVYGALGHEILESTSTKQVEVKTGSIFESEVTSIRKSSTGNAGEKNAEFFIRNTYGDLRINTNHGIYGVYSSNMNENTIEVGSKDDVRVGEASIYTVLDGNEKKEYTIEITSIQEFSDVKNISFQITDEELLQKAGGIIQGMSGSPIVQNGKLIGAVTHVIVDNPTTGYGIFITTMLETGDDILE